MLDGFAAQASKPSSSMDTTLPLAAGALSAAFGSSFFEPPARSQKTRGRGREAEDEADDLLGAELLAADHIPASKAWASWRCAVGRLLRSVSGRRSRGREAGFCLNFCPPLPLGSGKPDRPGGRRAAAPRGPKVDWLAVSDIGGHLPPRRLGGPWPRRLGDAAEACPSSGKHGAREHQLAHTRARLHGQFASVLQDASK